MNDTVQIDAKKKYINYDEQMEYMECNLYTGHRCVKIIIPLDEYNLLVRDGFFIRDGKTLDSANVLNTTHTYAKTH